MIQHVDYKKLNERVVKLSLVFSDGHINELILDKEDVEVLLFNLSVLSCDMSTQEETCRE
jgi:hypothetical protein